MTGPVYSANGKQVLRDGQHWGDMVGPDEAAAIADLLNDGRILAGDLPAERVVDIVKVLWS